MHNKKYIAIIGDIVDSREIKNRDVFQKKLNVVLDNINNKYSDDISSKFMITLGDEFQGLLITNDNLFNIIFEIEKSVYPTKIRFGIGIGAINTYINPEMSIGADGPAYHYARKMIDKLKIKESKYKNSPSNILIHTEKEDTNMLLESILELTYAIKSNWTTKQRHTIECYKGCGENQYETATKLNVTQSTVNKAIKSSMFYQYNNGIQSIQSYIKSGGLLDV